MEISGKLARLGWILLTVCLIAGCRAVAGGDSADDAKNWQGTWKLVSTILVSTIYDGQPQTADMEWIVDGDHYTIRLDGQQHVDPYPFTLDPSRKQIDVVHHETPPGTYGGELKGIYQISGDSLTVCYDLTGQRYPTSFDAKPGSRQVLYHFRRE
jgi:uncharacterized protein (TIGR03067 family)